MGRPRFGSRLVRIAVAAALLVLLAALAAPFLIPVDSYRPLLVGAIEARTGRQVQIDALKLYLFPTLRIGVINFRMKNPAGFPAGDALVAKSIDLGIAPQALLSRRLDVTDIAPSGVHVNVLRDAAGRTNFAAPVPSPTTALRTSIAAREAARIFTLEQVGAVNVNDAEITLADAHGGKALGPSISLHGVSAKIGSIDSQAPDWVKKLEIVADLRGAQLTTPLLAEPIDVHTGELTIKGGAARSTFAVSVGGVNLAGSAAFARLDPLSIAFAVTGPELDLDRLAMLLRPGAQSAAAASSTARLLARGTITIGKVLVPPLEASQMTGRLDVYTSAVRLNAYSLSAYGGTVRGSSALEGSAGIPIAVTARVHGLNLQRALAAIGLGTTNVTGVLDANFKLNTLLARDPMQALGAAGTFVVRNGSFPGIDLKGQLAQTARLMSLNVPSGDTRFSSFGGDLRIARERGYSNALILVATGMRGTIRGSFGFDQTLQYSGTGVLDPLAQHTSPAGSPVLALVQPILSGVLQQYVGATRVSVPFSLRGTFDHPQFSLTGAPQLLTTGTLPRAAQQPAVPTSLQDLVKLIPGL